VAGFSACLADSATAIFTLFSRAVDTIFTLGLLDWRLENYEGMGEDRLLQKTCLILLHQDLMRTHK
jgi:hypothetical protein